MGDIWRGWLTRLGDGPARDGRDPAETAALELQSACPSLGAEAPALRVEPAMGEGYAVTREAGGTVITGGAVGVLYGTYAWLLARAAGGDVPGGVQRPFYPLRMLDAWDNVDGTVERGYSGRSLWFEGGAFSWEPARIRLLGRLMASVGVNVLCVNNVNVKDGAERLIEDQLPGLARLADALRPYGVRLMVSVSFAQPLMRGLPTADPLDEGVAAWWRARADAVWAAVPDLAGFLVKADSEHRPGPFTYGRSHAEGANMLARAVAPHGGALVWRAFVYNCAQDWRDHSTDRPKAACDTYLPLDGQFDGNVLLQVKHGPYDFQVREPVSPTLLALRRTRMALELQLAQEYTGHQIDLYAMNPMWAELREDLPPEKVAAVAAVSNLGRDACMTGHPFAAANLYGYGRYAWDPYSAPEAVLADWVRLTYALPGGQARALTELLMRSRSVYERYTAPLGLCWMVRPGEHYGPSPEGYEYDLWGTYHRADRDAVGIDRTAAGTGYILQYPEALRARYADPATCPEKLVLFFHRLRYDWRMPDGRTLIQRIYDDHFEGAEEVKAMAKNLAALDLPEPDRGEAARRMEMQLKNAREWRDVINTYFHRLSGVTDEKGRKIYD
ncbi:MAG: alpha-glucuronidase [Clostridia bacterium]|nr:alpha-glucuronidase [Clostridia bacterium]